MHDLESFDPDQWPRKLNLGCGWDARPGYLNIDFQAYHEPDLVADVRDLPMLPEGAYDEIVAQDVLEHLTRDDGPVALAEWGRLLRPGGLLVLRVPNLLGLAHLFTQMRTVEEQEQLVQCLFGTQAYDGDFHQNGYTEHLLRHHLRRAGFGEASFAPRDEWLFDVEARKVPPQGELAWDDCPYMTLEQPSVVAARLAAGQTAGQTAGPAAEPAAPGRGRLRRLREALR